MSKELGAALDRLWHVIDSRRGADPKVSYTGRLFARGRTKIAQKLGEEAVETVIEGIGATASSLLARVRICSTTCSCCGRIPASRLPTWPPN